MRDGRPVDVKETVRSFFTWKSFRLTFLKYLYVLLPYHLIAGLMLSIFVFLPWWHNPEAPLLQEIGIRLVVLAGGIGYLFLAGWAFERGSSDLDRWDRAFSAIASIVTAGLMVSVSGYTLPSIVVATVLLLWAGYIFMSLYRENKNKAE